MTQIDKPALKADIQSQLNNQLTNGAEDRVREYLQRELIDKENVEFANMALQGVKPQELSSEQLRRELFETVDTAISKLYNAPDSALTKVVNLIERELKATGHQALKAICTVEDAMSRLEEVTFSRSKWKRWSADIAMGTLGGVVVSATAISFVFAVMYPQETALLLGSVFAVGLTGSITYRKVKQTMGTIKEMLNR